MAGIWSETIYSLTNAHFPFSLEHASDNRIKMERNRCQGNRGIPEQAANAGCEDMPRKSLDKRSAPYNPDGVKVTHL